MNWNHCETVTDLLPEYLGGVLDEERAAAVQRHLADCADCTAEHSLVASLRQHRATPGDGLVERIVRGSLEREFSSRFRSAGSPRLSSLSRPSLALAATLAMALLGGSLLLKRLNLQVEIADVTRPVVGIDGGGAGWIGVDAALVSGAASLQDLTVEELEQLLVEVGS